MKLSKKTWSDFYGEDTEFINQYIQRNNIVKEDEQILFAAFKEKLGFITLQIYLSTFLIYVISWSAITVIWSAFIYYHSEADKGQMAYILSSIPLYIFIYTVFGVLLLIVLSKSIEYKFLKVKETDFNQNCFIHELKNEDFLNSIIEILATLWLISLLIWYVFLYFQKEIIKFIVFVKELVIQFISHMDIQTIAFTIFIIFSIFLIIAVYLHAKRKTAHILNLVTEKIGEKE